MATSGSFNSDIEITVFEDPGFRDMLNDDRIRLSTTNDFVLDREVDPTQVFRVDEDEAIADEKPAPSAVSLKEQFESVRDRASQFIERLSKRSSGLTYVYDAAQSRNAPLVEATEAVFSYSTDTITFAMYRQALELLDSVDSVLVQRSFANGGRIG